MGGEVHNKCLGVLLVFITVPLVMLSIVNLGVDKLTTAKYYKELFKKNDAYRLTNLAIPKSDSSNKEIVALISQNITTSWLEKNITANLDQFDAYFNNRSSAIDPSIDVTSFKTDLTAELPPEYKSIVPDIISFSTYSNYLNQAETMVQQNAGFDATTDQENLNQLNQQISATQNTQQQFFQNLASTKSGYRLAIILRYVLYLLTILMLLCIGLAARHWYVAIFRWIGQTLLISGALTFGFFYGLSKIEASLNLMARINLSSEIKNIITPLYNNIFFDVTHNIEKISLIITAVGLIFVIISYILPIFSPAPAKPQKVEPTPTKPQ